MYVGIYIRNIQQHFIMVLNTFKWVLPKALQIRSNLTEGTFIQYDCYNK